MKKIIFLDQESSKWVTNETYQYLRDNFLLNGINLERRSKLYFNLNPIFISSLWSSIKFLEMKKINSGSVTAAIYHGIFDLERKNIYSESAMKILSQDHLFTNYAVTNSLMRDKLIDFGFNKSKIVKLLLGVNTKVYSPGESINFKILKQKLAIPQNSFCVGSFQKDGNGWLRGETPKQIKAPQNLINTLIYAKSHIKNLMVIISGPARGYVINELKKHNIDFRYVNADLVNERALLHQLLDVYISLSLDEGGPIGMIESLATGNYILTTNVGLARDMNEEIIGSKIEVQDVDNAGFELVKIYENKLHFSGKSNRIKLAKNYDWKIISEEYIKVILGNNR